MMKPLMKFKLERTILELNIFNHYELINNFKMIMIRLKIIILIWP